MDDNNVRTGNSVDRSAIPFIVAVTFILGLFLGFIGTSLLTKLSTLTTNEVILRDSSNVFNKDKVDEIYSILEQKYIGDLPSKDDVTQGLIKGMIGSLDDEYTVYLAPDEARKYAESRNPDFEGVGVSLKYNGENTEVESVLKGYPAEKAGMRTGDLLIAVDDSDVLGKYPAEVASKIRGEKGTKVKITVIRQESNDSQELNFDIVREKIEIDNVSHKNLGDGIVKIDISQFVDVTPDALNKSWDSIVNSVISENPNLKGIVLDLRNNPGGYVYSLRYIMEEFFKSNTILMKEQKNNEPEVVYRDEREGKFENVQVALLVNEGSASASEIFAAAIKDNDRGKVIGMETVGKGVEQEVVELKDGGLLIVVFQQWLSPLGNAISKENPIKPDIVVDYTQDDVKANRDPQLNKALEVIKK